ncbi:MAG: sulfotransferase domain-containing protein [Phycisphaerales bacterium JB065]
MSELTTEPVKPPPGFEEKRRIPKPLRGKPFRYVQRAVAQVVQNHPHRNLLILGQPKSGSTWVHRMLADLPGYVKWTPDNIKVWTNHDLRRSDFIPPARGYTVTKVHAQPSPENIAIVRDTQRPYIVTVRDPRDLAVSWAYFIANTKAVGYEDIHERTVGERISIYIDKVLSRILDWAIGWHDESSRTGQGLVLRYEQLLSDTHAQVKNAVEHMGVRVSESRLASIIDRHSFAKATGRQAGQEDSKAFNRKGIAGDWRNHFTPEHIVAFQTVAAGRMVELGYH